MTHYQARQQINQYVNLVKKGRIVGCYKLVMVHDDGDAFLLDKSTGNWFQANVADIKIA